MTERRKADPDPGLVVVREKKSGIGPVLAAGLLVIALLAVGVASTVGIVNAQRISHITDDLSDNQGTACGRANILSGYLQKRGRTLKGSTANDRAVITYGRPIVRCPSQIPLSRVQQDLYIRKLFACRCEPEIVDGHVTGRGIPFP